MTKPTTELLTTKRIEEMLAGLDKLKAHGPWFAGIAEGKAGRAGLSQVDNGTSDMWPIVAERWEAEHIARCDPDTMRAILTELLASRTSPATEAVAWPPLVELGRILGIFASTLQANGHWTDAAQIDYDKANTALQALYATPQPVAVKVVKDGQ